MADSNFWPDTVVKVLSGSGLVTVIGWLILKRKNRKQPIIKKLVAYTFPMPKVIPGYSATISLKRNNSDESQTYNFKQIGVIAIELVNISNKDFEEFKFKIAISENDKIISVQYQSQDDSHKVDYLPDISMDSPASSLDLNIIPFNRKDKYSITLMVNAAETNFRNNIRLSTALPIDFVNHDERFPIFQPIFFIGIFCALVYFTIRTYTNYYSGYVWIMTSILGLLSLFAGFIPFRNKGARRAFINMRFE